ncbi:MAG: DUF1028 domain-containing protein [Planctomycetes bacterium]|nr:DUF1028 domain-containing protein [Planctomycetota bacterium]
MLRPWRWLLACSLALALSARAHATWSIVVVDVRTGEVAVASATCLPGDLERLVPVVVPGVGAAAAQANGDTSGQNRQLIQSGFLLGLAPSEILAALASTDPGHGGRQYGIVDLFHAPVTHTGIGVGFAKPSRVGSVGDLRYAIQGNVLTGDEVVIAAEYRLLTTEGDLSERVLAAMLAARLYGGDGRCSCNFAHPTQCGSPPPDFEKSAHSGFLVVARIGDTLGTCEKTLGCATGSYYLDLNMVGKFIDPDPVRVLDGQYRAWRASMVGRVDQVHSDVRASKTTLVANGKDELVVTLTLADLERRRIPHGGHTVRIEPLNTPSPVTIVGALVDHGDGTYSFPIRAGTSSGVDTWRVIVTEQQKDVVLLPDVVVTASAPTASRAR